MRSVANFKGHPIHAALIPFPFAFLLGAFGFDLAGALLGDTTLAQTGRYLAIAGIVSALVAAVPGLVDYLFTVPPQSSGKKRATKHMILNLTTVAIFAFVAITRGPADASLTAVPLLLEAIGAGMLVSAGWMGGTLVNRNQIGVDHRYADAGKWKEENIDAPDKGPIAISSMDALKVSQMKLLRVNGKRLVLARTEDGYAVFDDRCTHKGASLADGALICGTVQCPWHGSQFDVRNGAVKAGPAKEPIKAHVVRERDGRVWLDFPE